MLILLRLSHNDTVVVKRIVEMQREWDTVVTVIPCVNYTVCSKDIKSKKQDTGTEMEDYRSIQKEGTTTVVTANKCVALYYQ
jgi:hypothetical protein